ncbi:MAG TPA: hypothetical protein VHD87_05045 [Acidimicrobiales bacterium]|nr:hypothetical protein [Acidimicrobiales bacterium]
MLDTGLAAGAAALAAAFCVATWERWLLKRRRHELAWSASFACYALASLALALGVAGGWNGFVFRLFYAAGAVATVPILAIGTIYLHYGRRVGDVVAAVTVVLVAVGVGVVMASPFVHPLVSGANAIPQGSKLFGAGPRIFAAVGSGVGATAVIVGSAYSALRGRGPLANTLIATGVIANGASGILNSVVGATRGFVVMLAIGITLLFAGFLSPQLRTGAVQNRKPVLDSTSSEV